MLLKDLLESQKTRFTNIWLQCQKNVSIDKLHEIVNKYNNRYHSTIQMKPAGVRCSTYIDFGIESNDKDHTFKFNDHIRISKCKNIFAKGDYSNWPEKIFVIKKVKDIVP